jgi:signal transduction histidine kinase
MCVEKSAQRTDIPAPQQGQPHHSQKRTMTPRQSPPWKRYGFAILSTLIALGLMLLLDPYLHLTQASFLLFFGAVTLSAFYGGRSPGLVATVLSSIFANYYFLEPRFSLDLTLPSGLRMALFILEGVVISLLVGALRVAQEQIRQHFHQLQATEAEVKDLNLTLQRRVDELQTLFDVIPVNIAIAEDPDCHVIRVNPAFAELLRMSPQGNASVAPTSPESKPTYRFFRNGQELTGDLLPQRYVARHRVALRDVEMDLVRGDGKVFHLYGHAVPLFDESGAPRGSVAVYIDISERKQLLKREQAAREAAERANRIKDEFLAILSHELRSPLNPILGWSSLLQTRTLGEAKTRHALATIERNAKLQTQLIDDLLDVARILRGKLPLEKTLVDVAMVIRAALEVVKTAAEAKSITLETYLSNIKPIWGDAARLQQIVWNLLSNAIKFTPNGGRVVVQLEQVGSGEQEHQTARAPDTPPPAYAKITVTDTGKGISQDFLPYLFQSFRQEDVSITRQHGGLGLGLSIVKYLVDAHGGSIQADSPGEGGGATFTVKLPLLRGNGADPEAALSPLSQVTLQGTKVLAVDDSEDARDLLEMVLMQYGAEVKVVTSGDEVLSQLPGFAPDVLVCDIGMPNMDGYTLLEHIRRLPPEAGGQVPAIAVTAFAGEDDRQKALSHGFDRHIAKPIEPDQLAQAIVELSR